MWTQLIYHGYTQLFMECGEYYLAVNNDGSNEWAAEVDVRGQVLFVIPHCSSADDAKQKLLTSFASHIKAEILGKQLLLNSIKELIGKE